MFHPLISSAEYWYSHSAGILRLREYMSFDISHWDATCICSSESVLVEQRSYNELLEEIISFSLGETAIVSNKMNNVASMS